MRPRHEVPGLSRQAGLQNPCEGMRNARLKREDAFSHAMISVSSAKSVIASAYSSALFSASVKSELRRD
jgi:hypothetical protein